MNYELYAVINTGWKKKGWSDWFYEPMLAVRGEDISVASIFITKKEAEKFIKIGKNKKDKIIKLTVVDY